MLTKKLEIKNARFGLGAFHRNLLIVCALALLAPCYASAATALSPSVNIATALANATGPSALVGTRCPMLGTTQMDPTGSYILSCLVNASNQPTWYLAGTNSVPTCPSGQAFNWDGVAFNCVPISISSPTCAAGQVLSFNGTALQCIYINF